MLLTDYLIGLDLGQQNDYTVISVFNLTFFEDPIESLRYDLLFLVKFPLRLSYPKIVKNIKDFIDEFFSVSKDYLMIVDYTGVGRPIVDLFRESNIDVVALNIIGGNSVNWNNDKQVNVPKKELISSLQIVLQEKRIRIADDVYHLEDLKREFINFRGSFTSHGNAKFGGIIGSHDDIVLSIGLPIWFGEHSYNRGRNAGIFAGYNETGGAAWNINF